MNPEFARLSKDYNILKISELNEYMEKYDKLNLTYYIDPEFEELNHAIICVIGNNSLFEKEREMMNRLNDELLYLTDFSIDVKSLISVRLWWL